MKITHTKCIDGKRHKWKTINIRDHYGTTYWNDWCEKCGSTTEFFKEKEMKKRERCYQDTWDEYGNRFKKYDIEVPETLELVKDEKEIEDNHTINFFGEI